MARPAAPLAGEIARAPTGEASSTMEWRARLRENLRGVRAAVAAACARVGRDAADVHLVGVTKYVTPAVAAELAALGVADLGESRPQQLVARAREIGQRLDWPGAGSAAPAGGAPRWHLIGHLQRNKVKLLLPHCRSVHSLDSVRLARELEQRAAELDAAAGGVDVDVFVEINVPGEATKSGAEAADAAAIAATVAGCPHLRLRGLMTMAPYNDDPEASRPHFARLRELRDGLRRSGAAGPECVHLSMGMSQDYVVAVEQGATFIRVGSALFAGLETSDPR
jgi:pyridoxal phosphate enzyme (YggS family)